MLTKLVAVGSLEASSEDLKTKCTRALKFIIEKLTDLSALDKTLQESHLPAEVGALSSYGSTGSTLNPKP